MSPAALVELAACKMKSLWWDRGLSWSMGGLKQQTPTLFALLEELDRAMFTCALFLAALGAIALFRRPKEDFKLYLLPFVMFATSCVYLLIEVQPRYAYAGRSPCSFDGGRRAGAWLPVGDRHRQMAAGVPKAGELPPPEIMWALELRTETAPGPCFTVDRRRTPPGRPPPGFGTSPRTPGRARR